LCFGQYRLCCYGDIEKTVRRVELQKFVGELTGQGASKRAFITTATSFTKEAKEY